jgi:hypothetical protein
MPGILVMVQSAHGQRWERPYAEFIARLRATSLQETPGKIAALTHCRDDERED